MAPYKGKKGSKKKPSSEKNASRRTISGSSSSSWPTPNFPHQLRPWKMDKYKSWGSYGVTKSWKLPSKRCNSNGNGNDTPLLQLSCDIRERFLNVQDYIYLLKIPFLPSGFYTYSNKLSISTLRGHCSEWWAYPCYYSSSKPMDFFLSSKQVYIPTGGIMLLTGVSSPSLFFLPAQYFQLPGSPIQVQHLDLKITDPYDPEQQYIIFTNAIGFHGKFYALSLHGALAVIEEVNSKFTITGMGKNRVVPSVTSRRFIEYLIESDGEILLAFLVSRKSISMIDYVEVMRLDFGTMLWVKMDNLGNRTLFLAGTGRGIAVSANQVPGRSDQVFCKRNHVYFTHQGINCWKEFDLGSTSIVSTCCNF